VTARFVRGLADVGAADAARAGGKAAALGELGRAGMPVPHGYVITADAFTLVMAALDPSGAIRGALEDVPADDLAAIARATADLRARITAAPLPSDVAGEITLAHGQLGATAVAVRSSATMEDSPEASFAGLQDSYLAVRGADAVLDRVRSCWASLYNDESVSYRRRRGDVHPQPGHRRPLGGGHRGNLGARLGPGGRRGDAGQLHGQQGDW
jgi:pyruvate,water dikinase